MVRGFLPGSLLLCCVFPFFPPFLVPLAFSLHSSVVVPVVANIFCLVLEWVVLVFYSFVPLKSKLVTDSRIKLNSFGRSQVLSSKRPDESSQANPEYVYFRHRVLVMKLYCISGTYFCCVERGSVLY